MSRIELLIVRHAIAMDRDLFAESGAPDAERPLTNRGRIRMRAAARGLATLVPRIDLLATSPFTRARQTAGVISRAFVPRGPSPVVTRYLTPGSDPADLMEWLKGERPTGSVVLVGHEPHLSLLTTWLLTGRTSGVFLGYKKGGVAALSVETASPSGRAQLHWFLAPRQLRALDPQKR